MWDAGAQRSNRQKSGGKDEEQSSLKIKVASEVEDSVKRSLKKRLWERAIN